MERQFIVGELFMMLEKGQPDDLFRCQSPCPRVLQVSGQGLLDHLFKGRILCEDSAYRLKKLCLRVTRSGNCEW